MLFHESGRKNLRWLDFYDIYADLWMLVMLDAILFDHVLLLLLVGRWQTQFLLSLVIHHLLHEASSFTIEIGKLARLGVHFLRADLRIAGYHVSPPLHFVHLWKQSKILAVSDRKIEDGSDIALISESWKLICFKYLSLIGNKEN